jgi:hypothetical protein
MTKPYTAVGLGSVSDYLARNLDCATLLVKSSPLGNSVTAGTAATSNNLNDDDEKTTTTKKRATS